MRFYRKKIQAANGEVIHRDYYEMTTGNFKLDKGEAVAQDLRGEVDGQTIMHYPALWDQYIKELKDAGEPLPQMNKYFAEGAMLLNVEPDSNETSMPQKIEVPTKPDVKDENGNVIPSASPDAEENKELEEEHPEEHPEVPSDEPANSEEKIEEISENEDYQG